MAILCHAKFHRERFFVRSDILHQRILWIASACQQRPCPDNRAMLGGVEGIVELAIIAVLAHQLLHQRLISHGADNGAPTIGYPNQADRRF
jgi:hypothetical protein